MISLPLHPMEPPEIKARQGEGAVETYIVTLKNQSSSNDLDDINERQWSKKVQTLSHVYSHSINGFSVQIPTDKKPEIVNSLVTDMRVGSVLNPMDS